MRFQAVSAVSLALAFVCFDVDGAAIFWPSSNPSSGGPGTGDLSESIDLYPDSSAEITLWSRLDPATTNLTILGLGVEAENSGADDVLDFVGVTILNPLLDTSDDLRTYRHQFVIDSTVDSFSPCDNCVVAPGEGDTLEDFSGLSIGFAFPVVPTGGGPPDHFRIGAGIGAQAESFGTDPHLIEGNWRIGTIEFVPIHGGTTTLTLYEGAPVDSPAAESEPEFNFHQLNLTIQILPDYNRNGQVDTTDYTVWRDAICSVGCSAAQLVADGDFDGDVDLDDYETWKEHFEVVAPVGTAAAVPEPASICFVLPAIGLPWLFGRATRH